MLHHVSIEVEPAEIDRATEFWTLLGFAAVEPPQPLADSSVWLEREGTQVHLIPTKQPTTPHGHIAVVAPDFERTVAQLREHGFEVAPKRELWNSPRALAIAPGGHRVELMAAPP
jgi:catechol 2,3-dioxygenase-like lactoylglutathione lyase family enzyme